MAELLVESALRKVLTDDADISVIVGSNIFPILAPQTQPLPYGVYSRVSQLSRIHMTGADPCSIVTIEMEWWESTYTLVKALAAEARKAAHGFRGTVTVGADSLVVNMIELESEDDEVLDPSDGEKKPIGFGVVQTYIIYAPQITT